MLKVRDRWKGIIDLQLVAFPQDGLSNKPEVQKHFRNALEMGVDVIGGIPAVEDSIEASQEHLDFLFQAADDFNKDIDMHIDESDDPASRTLEKLADLLIKLLGIEWLNI